MSIKVLHLIDSGGLYGAENMLLNLVEEQVKAGLQPMILSAGTPEDGEKPLEVEARKRGLPIMPFRMKAGLNLLKGLEVVRHAKKEGYDILHSHGYKFNILLGAIPKRIRKIPIVTTVHGYVHAKRLSKMWVYQVLDRIFLSQIDKVVLVSKEIEKKVKVNSIVINNGINVIQDSPSENTKIDKSLDKLMSESEFVIGSFGRLTSEKGFVYLIEAFKKLLSLSPKSLLVIWGEGYLRNDLLKVVKNNQLEERVKLPGFTNAVSTYLEKIDILVMPSLTEGLPIILLEALRSKVPVIATNVGSIPEVLNYGGCGVLVEPRNSNALADALINMSKGIDPAVTTLAYERLKSEYSSTRMAVMYFSAYKQL